MDERYDIAFRVHPHEAVRPGDIRIFNLGGVDVRVVVQKIKAGIMYCTFWRKGMKDPMAGRIRRKK